MQLSSIYVDGFGVLSRTEIDHLDQGFNLIYGNNGAGKTTLLQFLRGLFCNFAQARRARLLPPLKGGKPGGSVEIKTDEHRLDLIRFARQGHPDTLAIKTVVGDEDAADRLRQQLGRLDHDLLKNLFFVSGPEANTINELAHLALRDGIELRHEKRSANWIAEKIEEVEQERQDLFGPQPSRNQLELLKQRKQEIAGQLEENSQKQQARERNWAKQIYELEGLISQLSERLETRSTHLQLLQSDLFELEHHIWSQRERSIHEQQPVKRIVKESSPHWVREIEEIDRQIEHAQQVLRDLASSRLKLSLSQADLAGVETPDRLVILKRQREALERIDRVTAEFQSTLNLLERKSSPNECYCHKLQDHLTSSVALLQRQVAMLCSDLSRQQVGLEQVDLNGQRASVDRCEIELTQQIRSLRLRRDHLLQANQTTAQANGLYFSKHETAYCECSHHPEAVRAEPQSEQGVTTKIEYEVVTRTVLESAGTPAERQRAQSLNQKKVQLQKECWQLTTQLRDAKQKLVALRASSSQKMDDQTILKLEQESSAIEQQLADAQEQWQSLAALQTVLQRTKEKMQVAVVSPVIEQASTLLKEMTQGRYIGLRFDSSNNEMLVVSDQNSQLPIHALSRGTLEQASLCFRLALWTEYRRRGYEFPLILDEVLADSDEDRLHVAIKTLLRFSEEEGQIIFMTCQEHLVELFEQESVQVRHLLGSTRPMRDGDQAVHQGNQDLVAFEKERTATVVERVSTERIQPDTPYWLEVTSPAALVPSLGEQMSRRIGSIGVSTVADLIEVDPEVTEIPLESLQISAATLRNWQAEARLLCCVPNLTGKDAQILVLCGIYSPSELAEADPSDLHFRATRLQEAGREYEPLHWLSSESGWPTLEHFTRWIQFANHARSYRTARERKSRHLRHDPAHVQTMTSKQTSRRNRTESSVGIRQQSSSDNVKGMSHVKLHRVEEEASREYRFFLEMDSPLVESPGIGPRTAARFKKIGVMTVSDLVNRDAAEMSKRLQARRITEEVIRSWQQQAILVCRVPELRGHDANVLVECELTDIEAIAAMSPQDLYKIVKPFVNSTKGQRILRSAKTPDLEEVTDWIEFANNSRSLKAA